MLFRKKSEPEQQMNRIQKNGVCVLPFPEPKIIYLSSNGNTPDWYTVQLDFGTQGSFDYTVSAFKYLDTTLTELNEKKMVILIPFQLLRFRDMMKKKRSLKTLEALKSLIKDDIIGSINENLRVGNITMEDALKLKRYTQTLYDYLYAHYDEMEDFDDMTDESYMTDIDIICKERDEALAAKDRERDEALAAKDRERDEALATKDRERDEALAAKDKEIAQLKEQLAKLQTT